MILLAFALIFYNLLQTAIRAKKRSFTFPTGISLPPWSSPFSFISSGNAVWNPSTGAITGMPDAILAWFYGHGVVGLFLTPLAVAVAYYVIPIVSRSPLYSHTLSLVGFWTILMIYTHIGTHHLLQTPVPTWLKVLAITGSIGMLAPGHDGSGQPLADDARPPGIYSCGHRRKIRLCGAGLVHPDLLPGTPASLPVIQRVTHLNNWVIAHAHMGVLGFSGTIALGGIYFILPRLRAGPSIAAAWRISSTGWCCWAWPAFSSSSPPPALSRETAG